MKKYIVAFIMLVLLIAAVPASASTISHTVNHGETLWSVARTYDISLEDLVNLNPKAEVQNLIVGSELVVGVEAFANLYHVVQEFDSLQSIAEQYQVPQEIIVDANGLNNNQVVTNQTIKIPVPDGNHTVPFTLKQGETLASIAEKYNTTVAFLEKLNYGINADDFKAGDRIFVPANKVHTVTTNENINKIAEDYGINVNDLLVWNDLNYGEMLLVGQKLVVEL